MAFSKKVEGDPHKNTMAGGYPFETVLGRFRGDPYRDYMAVSINWGVQYKDWVGPCYEYDFEACT